MMNYNCIYVHAEDWKEFFIGGEEGVFKISSTLSGIDKNKLQEITGHVPYITRSNINNGIDTFVGEKQLDKFKLNNGNVISIGLDTQTVFYQKNDFYTGQNIQVLYNENLNQEISLFIIPLLKIQMAKFNWGGNGATLGRLNRTKIMLPVDKNGHPDWQFMEDYIKQERKNLVDRVIEYYKHKTPLKSQQFIPEIKYADFKIGDIFGFERKPSKGLNHLMKNNQGISYLGATNRNNGVLDFVAPVDNLIYTGNCIAFIRNGEGSMGYAIYKKESFIATQDISVGYNENLNQYNSKYITTIADRVRGKYNFGYKRNQPRLESETLILPVTESGEINWGYMDYYIRFLEQEKTRKIIAYYEAK